VLLAGLLLDAMLGWDWADPIAGLVIAGVAAKEGIQAWHGENCGCTPTTRPAEDDCCAADATHHGADR
jgi:Co/Zn/Cd efflux system component